jgi:hypothetical protein
MQLQWVSVALTLTGVFIWFSGGNQGLGYGIFMAGGVMWFILERAEKKKQEKAKQSPVKSLAPESIATKKPKSLRQSDLR